ncbi:hypothetical protein MKX01_016187 [Papaver californicum]|nr:hypothetical protein MKX01_016187 [Papaver californicum]
MALKISSSIVPSIFSLSRSSVSLSRRLPLVGALCMLSFGLANLSSSLSSSSFKPPWSGFSGRLSSVKGIHSGGGMEGNTNTVPSIVVYVTVPTKEAGKKLAESIVTEKLAACVNRVPGVESVYQWEGKIQTDSEELLIIKTRESLLEPLKVHIKANHEYDVPEVIAIPIIGGSLQYLEWLKKSTRD